MGFFTAAQKASVIADPATFPAIYASEKARFLAALPEVFNTPAYELIEAGMSSIMAYELKPYGEVSGSGIAPLTENECLTADFLGAESVCALTWWLNKRVGFANGPSIVSLQFIGIKNGPLGTHTYLEANTYTVGYGGLGWILDPKYGIIVAEYNYNWIGGGWAPTNSNQIATPGGKENRPDETVAINAILGGLHRPKHLEYYFNSFNHFAANRPWNKSLWPTPQINLDR